MPIIDDVSYPPYADTPEVQRKIILHYPLSLYKHESLYSRRKRFGNTIRRMFRSENNLIRPRKNTRTPWQIQDASAAFNAYRGHDFALSLPQDHHKDPRQHSKKSGGYFNVILSNVENYCDKSTLHGLRYIGDPTLSMGERLFWLAAFLSAIGFASYYITNIYYKWNNYPVVISFNPFDAKLRDFPFPAITICNMNQVKKGEAERILREGSGVEKKLLRDYCSFSNSFNGSSEQAPDWNVIQSFMVKVGQSCTDILKACYWKGDKVNCDDYFNNDLTDEGLCCSFNRLPPALIFRNVNDVAVLNQTYPNNVYDWTPEVGFTDRPTGEDTSVPLRPNGAGTHLGLTVIADVQLDNYFCSSTDSTGFKLIMSNPIEAPKIADFGFLVGPGTEARYVIQPVIREATDALRGVAISKRRCYFANERRLIYYRTYTSRNCRQECQSNYTYSKCNCIPYFLPKSKSIKVCGKSDEVCFVQAKEDMELTYGNGSNCRCLPGCFETMYDKSESFSQLSDDIPLRYDFDNVSQKYFIENMAVLHFFFQDSEFRKTMKSEIYGFTEVLSNVGGLLGLCSGFSFLSFIELTYFLTLRVFCGYLHKRRKVLQMRNRNGDNRNSNTIPFVK